MDELRSFRPWVNVSDRLPDNQKERFEDYIVLVSEGYWPEHSFDPDPHTTEYKTVATYDRDQKVWRIIKSDAVVNALISREDAPLNGVDIVDWTEFPKY